MMLKFKLAVLTLAIGLPLESYSAGRNPPLPIQNYQRTLSFCRSLGNAPGSVAIRSWSEGINSFYLTVNPDTLETRIQNLREITCESVNQTQWLQQNRRYSKWLQFQRSRPLDPRNA